LLKILKLSKEENIKLLSSVPFTQKHTGEDKTILAQRAVKKLQARKMRLEMNGKRKDQVFLPQAA
jgi:hypothetical protein